MFENPKILIVAMKYGYGIKERGLSYEYAIIYDNLKRIVMEKDALFFDYMSLYIEHGKAKMNEMLLELVEKEKPDISIFFLYTDQFIPEILDAIKKKTITINYNWDDQWRIKYVKYWTPHFTYSTTPDITGERKWRERGYESIFYCPFGCNKHIYKKLSPSSIKKYDISFVGTFHPYRNLVIKKLQRQGYNIYVAGHGWKNGVLTFDEMVRVFNESKINLNISNTTSYDINYITSSLRALKDVVVSLINRDVKNIEQIKGRHYEISSCGGFQLSYFVEGLEHAYEIGKEIAIYTTIEDLLEKVRYYLKDDEERENIAYKGYLRTINDHTYEERFKKMFSFVEKTYCE